MTSHPETAMGKWRTERIAEMLHDRAAILFAVADEESAAIMQAAANALAERDAEVARLTDGLRKLLLTAALLFQNAEGCAQNHYGHNPDNGLPGWLVDSKADIDSALALLPPPPQTAQGESQENT